MLIMTDQLNRINEKKKCKKLVQHWTSYETA